MGEPFNDDMWVNMYTKQVLWKLIAGQVLQEHLKKVAEVMETIWNDILFTFMDATSELKKKKNSHDYSRSLRQKTIVALLFVWQDASHGCYE